VSQHRPMGQLPSHITFSSNAITAVTAVTERCEWPDHSDFIHVDVGRVRQWCFDGPGSLIAGD